MKKGTATLLILLCFQFIFGQLMDYENQAIENYKTERSKRNQSTRKVMDISGICDAFTIATNQNSGTGWDECDGATYEGTIEFESVNNGLYNVYSINSFGERLNDHSFGTYYGCYEVENQSSMPNADADFPTLFFSVNELGELSFSGKSQWGEIYALSNLEMNGSDLKFSWTNDYGEGADVMLTRQDGQIWESLLDYCITSSESDSLTLVALYNATNGPNWHIPWDLNAPMKNWYGITVNPPTCQVTEINLGPSAELNDLGFNGNNLSGLVPDEIGNLTELLMLDLRNNSLEGEVLPKLTSLTNLHSLLLSNNLFSGSIIPELSNLEPLEVISLTGNNFNGDLPEEINTLSNLRILFSSDNTLTGEIPAEYGQFQSLQQISMWGNDISGALPSELGNIETLENISFDFNNLSGEIPASIGSLPNLIILRLSFNELTGSIPPGLENIIFLRLNDNNMSGEIPGSLAVNSLLNGFSPLEINFTNNNFTGEIPNNLIINRANQSIYLANNNFHGCVEEVENLCLKSFNPIPDTLMIGNDIYLIQLRNGYDLSGNPKLAWEGDLQNACAGETQIGAPCNDGDPNTSNDGIDENCNCVPDIVSTKDIKELNSIAVYPNPLGSGDCLNVNLDLNQNINATIVLLDLNGNVLTSKSLGTINGIKDISLETNHLNSGLYFLQIVSENRVASIKIVIQ